MSNSKKKSSSASGPVLYCGDPHGRFDHIVRAAGELHACAVVLLGDLTPARALHEELAAIVDKVWFIHGNHDTDSQALWERVWDSSLAARNVDGRVVTLPNGTRLAGLGGVFRESVWYPTLPTEAKFRTWTDHRRATPHQDRWREGPPRRHWGSIYPETVERLAKLRTDVLVTHEAPGYHRNGFEVLDGLARSMGAKVTVHGHHHDRLDSSERWVQQGFGSFGVGLRGITAIDASGAATVIVKGELDEARDYSKQYLDVFKDVPE